MDSKKEAPHASHAPHAPHFKKTAPTPAAHESVEAPAPPVVAPIPIPVPLVEQMDTKRAEIASHEARAATAREQLDALISQHHNSQKA